MRFSSLLPLPGERSFGFEQVTPRLASAVNGLFAMLDKDGLRTGLRRGPALLTVDNVPPSLRKTGCFSLVLSLIVWTGRL